MGDSPPVIRISAGSQVVEACPGDLLVSYRISRYQRISNVSGDPITHVAILDVRAGRAVTSEMGPAGVFERTLEKFAERYDWFAVVHLDATPGQRGVIVASAHRALAEQRLRYSHAQAVGVGTYAFARHWLPLGGRALSWVTRVWVRLAYRANGGVRMTCSGFVAQCFVPAGVIEAMVLPTRHRPTGFGRVQIADLRLWEKSARRPSLAAGPWAVIVSPTDMVVCTAHTHISVFGPTEVEVVPRRDLRGVPAGVAAESGLGGGSGAKASGQEV